MRRSLLVLAVGLTLLAAGCLSGLPGSSDSNASDEVDPSSADDPEEAGNASDEGNDTSNGNESDDNGTREDEDADNGTREGNDTSDEHPPWPSPSEASVRPGVEVETPGGFCTSNFVFRTPDNASLMLGVAAHCFAGSPRAAGDGCSAAKEPLEPGTEARIEGADEPGTLVYSSWWSMQQGNETDGAACADNDFALVELPDGIRDTVSPAVERFGGPSSIAGPGNVTGGDKVLFFGNSPYRPDTEPTRSNEGYLLGTDGWVATTYTAAPGIPGDSGSGVLTGDGRALGVVTTVNVSPFAGSNDAVLLEPALAYAASADVDAELATWELIDSGTLPG